MHLPFSAIVGYVLTIVIAVAGAGAHPWFEAEAHFVKAVTGMAAAAAAAFAASDSR